MIELRHTAQGETRESYDGVYAGEEMPQHALSYYRWILRQLHPRPGASLLDVCCGNGQLMQVAQAAGLQVAGVDFSQVAVGNASAHGLCGQPRQPGALREHGCRSARDGARPER